MELEIEKDSSRRFFHQLDRDLQAELFALGQQSVHETGTIVMQAGSSSSSLHILLSGDVKVYRRGRSRQLCLSVLQSGDMFGELSMIDEGAASASISAMSRCEILSIEREAVFEFLHRQPEFLRQFLDYISLRLRGVIDEVCAIALDDVYGRLRRTLLRLARQHPSGSRIESVTHMDLAELVGSSREMVSIILKELRVGDYIRSDGRAITILRTLPENR